MKYKSFIFVCICWILACPVYAQYHLDHLSKDTRKLIEEAKYCYHNTDVDCIPNFKKALEHAINNKDCIPCAEVELGRNYYFENKLDSAYYHFEKVINDIKKWNNRLRDELEIDAYSNMAMIQNRLGKPEQAIEYLLKCGEKIDKLGKKEQAALLKVNMALIYASIENLEKSIELNRAAFKELQDLEISRQTAIIASNLAANYHNTQQYDSSIVWAHKTIKLAIAQNNKLQQASGYDILAASYSETKRNDSAAFYAPKALHLARETNDQLYIANSLSVLGNLKMDEEKYSDAANYYEEALKIYESLNQGMYIPSILEKTAEAYYHLNNFEKAAKHYHNYTILNKEIISEDNRKIVQELNTKYETEKKERLLTEKELELEKQENKNKTTLFISSIIVLFILTLLAFFRVKQKNKLQQIQKEKENAVLNSFINGEERERIRISQELHDGLAALVSAAKMGLEALPHLDETSKTAQINKTKNILENTHAEIRHISHNLMPLTLEKEGLIVAVKQFANDINDMQLINLTVSDKTNQSLNFQKNVELMLFRIIQELINNILKHSQAKNAEIIFEHKANNQLSVEVNDDGNGFEGSIKSNQGLYSIQQRLMAIGGNFTFKRGKTSGMQAIAEIKL